jgi:predicted transcriptional regulator
MALKKFSIAVNIDTVKELDKLAQITERKRNWLINKAIDEYLEKNKDLLENSVDRCD